MRWGFLYLLLVECFCSWAVALVPVCVSDSLSAFLKEVAKLQKGASSPAAATKRIACVYTLFLHTMPCISFVTLIESSQPRRNMSLCACVCVCV